MTDFSKDWLWPPSCRLCTRTDVNAGREYASRPRYDTTHRLHGMPDTDAEKTQLAPDLCWWCLWRACKWFETAHLPPRQRRAGPPPSRPMTSWDISAFITHATEKKLKWVGDPNAYPACAPLEWRAKKEPTRRAQA